MNSQNRCPRSRLMGTFRISRLTARAAAALLALATLSLGVANAAPRALPDGMISGVVKSTKGPEAGVWVIAETDELQTHFIKIVVTDDAGRFALPQLPNATFNLWVRGYGLVDSDKVKGRPGDTGVELTAKIAPTPADAAKVYPGNYWLSLLQPPAKSEFPGTGPSGNGIPPRSKSRASGSTTSRASATSATSSAPRSRARSATWITWASSRRRRRGSIARSSACAAATWRASSPHPACRFPALGAPVCLVPRVMGPIVPGRLSHLAIDATGIR